MEAKRNFPTELLLTRPTVVFDELDDFWVGVMNSPQKDRLLERVEQGDLVPINAEALTDITSVHALFHDILSRTDDVPVIPTITMMNGAPGLIANRELPRTIDGVFVRKKKDTEETMHGGRGVSVVRVTSQNATELLPQSHMQFLQQFVVPPDEWMRDIRVFIVGGEPVSGAVRFARDPLRPENLSGDVLPTESQFPTARHMGRIEPLAGAQKDVIFQTAHNTAQAIEEYLRGRKRPFAPESQFGFGSLDFLLDSSGTPLPVDIDFNPVIARYPQAQRPVANAMAKFLLELSRQGGDPKDILIMGTDDYPVTAMTYQLLQNNRREGTVHFQESALKKLLMEGL